MGQLFIYYRAPGGQDISASATVLRRQRDMSTSRGFYRNTGTERRASASASARTVPFSQAFPHWLIQTSGATSSDDDDPHVFKIVDRH